MRKAIAMAAVGAVAALALAACGSAPEENAAGGNAGGEEKAFLACMVSDAGGFDDHSFNESGFKGLERAKAELPGVDFKTYESTGEADFKNHVDTAISDGCDLVFGVGFLLHDTIKEAAETHPDVKFALVDDNFHDADFKPVEIENAKALVFNTAEAGFLAGYLAGGMTKTGKVGTFLGMQLPTTAIFADGFDDGIKQYNQDNGKDVQLLGWSKDKQEGSATGDFENPQKGQQFTENFLQQGADIIMPVAGPVGKGALSAVKAAGGDNMIIWVDSDGYESNPEEKSIILTSVMKEIGQAVFDTIKEASEGKFTSKPYIGTVANGGVSIAPYHDFEDKVPAELKAKVDEYKEKIASGELKVESENSPK